jgi:hypothetical protein
MGKLRNIYKTLREHSEGIDRFRYLGFEDNTEISILLYFLGMAHCVLVGGYQRFGEI